MRSLQTPAKRPPLGPRALDTPAKREIHPSYTPRKRLFTSTFAVPPTVQPNKKGASMLLAPGWHQSRHERDQGDSQPLRLSSPTSPAMKKFRGIGKPVENDPLGEEILKNLFERHAADVKQQGPVVAFEWFVRGVQCHYHPHIRCTEKDAALIESESKQAILKYEYEQMILEMERKHEQTVAALQAEIQQLISSAETY